MHLFTYTINMPHYSCQCPQNKASAQGNNEEVHCFSRQSYIVYPYGVAYHAEYLPKTFTEVYVYTGGDTCLFQ